MTMAADRRPTPVRLRLSRKAGFNLQAHSHATNGLPAINVARPGRWGNPFIIGKEYARITPGGRQWSGITGDAEQAVRLYRHYTAREVQTQIEAHRQLHGRNLACWCAPDAPCHADVLLKIANTELEDKNG